MSCECQRWSAVATERDGARELRVTCECECTSTGHRLRLEPGNPGINPQPGEVVLELWVEEPQAGGSAMTAERVELTTTVWREARYVVIRGANLDGPVPIEDA